MAEITLEAWVFFDGFDPQQTIVARGFTADAPPPSFPIPDPIWFLGLIDTKLTFRSNHGASSLDLVSTFPFQLSTWTHLAATYDGATKRLFVNGAEVAAQPVSTPLNYVQASGLVTIGMRCRPDLSSSTDLLLGRIDELAIYNRALTQNEIATIFGADSQGKNTIAPYFTTPSILPGAFVGTAYSQTLQTVLGTPPVAFDATSDESFLLPPGIVLADGTLSGTPTLAGTFDFNVRCTDAAGHFIEQLFVLSVT